MLRRVGKRERHTDKGSPSLGATQGRHGTDDDDDTTDELHPHLPSPQRNKYYENRPETRVNEGG